MIVLALLVPTLALTVMLLRVKKQTKNLQPVRVRVKK